MAERSPRTASNKPKPMSKRIRIRPATLADMKALPELAGASFPGKRHNQQLRDGCILVAASRESIIASALVDLRCAELSLFFSADTAVSAKLLRRLVAEAEKLAARFSVFEFVCDAPKRLAPLLRSLGYDDEPDPVARGQTARLRRTFPRRQTSYGRLIAERLAELGIPADYALRHRMPLQPESRQLVSIGADIYERTQRLAPGAARAWRRMREAARMDGIDLQVVSAFRSADYQTAIVERKLRSGQAIDEILRVSAAPGYSEHHSGRALDLTTPAYAVLEEEFETSPAFAWLQGAASRYGFWMSFPRDNRHGVAYEPWHWAWRGA